MPNRAQFKNLASEIFDEFEDIVMDAVLEIPKPESYTPGGVINFIFPSEYSIRVVEADITDLELSAGIATAGDRLFLTPVIELAVVPGTKDFITLSEEGVKMSVYRVKADPARALWKMWVRK